MTQPSRSQLMERPVYPQRPYKTDKLLWDNYWLGLQSYCTTMHEPMIAPYRFMTPELGRIRPKPGRFFDPPASYEPITDSFGATADMLDTARYGRFAEFEFQRPSRVDRYERENLHRAIDLCQEGRISPTALEKHWLRPDYNPSSNYSRGWRVDELPARPPRMLYDYGKDRLSKGIDLCRDGAIDPSSLDRYFLKPEPVYNRKRLQWLNSNRADSSIKKQLTGVEDIKKIEK